jgi:hypothetical protein
MEADCSSETSKNSYRARRPYSSQFFPCRATERRARSDTNWRVWVIQNIHLRLLTGLTDRRGSKSNLFDKSPGNEGRTAADSEEGEAGRQAAKSKFWQLSMRGCSVPGQAREHFQLGQRQKRHRSLNRKAFLTFVLRRVQ